MDAQKAIEELTTHLLGDDWYIVDSVSTDQANEVIVEEIKSRYTGAAESPINKWRRSRVNRRCKFCKHYREVPCVCVGAFGKEFNGVKGVCNAKDRAANGNIHRPFCKVFQLKSFYETEEK